MLRCSVRRDGGLRGCTVVSETPPDVGFGAAALKMAAKLRFRPEYAKAGASVRVPFIIRLVDPPLSDRPPRGKSSSAEDQHE